VSARNIITSYIFIATIIINGNIFIISTTTSQAQPAYHPPLKSYSHFFLHSSSTPSNNVTTMPSLSKTIFALLLTSTTILALPTPQLAGEGAAANSLLSGTDDAVGHGIEVSS
jgi:hypothetical protein